MEKTIKIQILNDKQIKKFSAYGFLKNLSFFKPYLLLYLLNFTDLFQIGILYAIRETIIYIFEIPSGIIADYFGRKKELCLCFCFYIISFVIFYFANSFELAAIAMMFFGLGEAFRSGTHKAMILTYLEQKEWDKYKSFVYGRTRSFSLIGTALSSLFAILLVLSLKQSKLIFLITIIPYLIDFFLILSYPDSIDQAIKKKNKQKIDIKKELKNIFSNYQLYNIIIDQGVFQAVYKTTKDMIQPIFSAIILASGLMLWGQNADNSSKIVIGFAYFIINLTSAFASRNAYRLQKYVATSKLMKGSFIALICIMLLLSFAVKFNILLLSAILFFALNIIQDSRKPIYLERLDEEMDKKHRATVLSIESQFTALSTVIIAPSFGKIASVYGISAALLSLSIALFFVFILVIKKRK